MSESFDLILFDGVCGLCDRSVRFLLARDRRRRLRFAPLSGETAARLLPQLNLPPGGDSLVFLRRSGATWVASLRSAAVLEAAAALGGLWAALARLGRLVPRRLADALYDAVARRRYRWFGRRSNCRIPSPGEADRFLP